MTLIYFNESLLDIGTAVFALTIKSFDPLSINKRFSNYTPSIKLPRTENNTVLFGFPDNVKSQSSIPYRKGSVYVIQDGIEIITNYIGIVKQADDNFILNIFSKEVDFFDAIKDKPINGIVSDPLSWSSSTLSARNNSLTDIVRTPLVDYGVIAVPQFRLKNPGFSNATIAPWFNFGATGQDWTGSASVVMPVGTSSKYLRQEYSFKEGYEYSIRLELTVISVSVVVTISLWLVDEDGNRTQLGTDQNYNSTGDKAFTRTQTMAEKYVFFEVLADNGGIANSSVSLTYFSGSITQPTINVEMPFYLPSIQYKALIEGIVSDSAFTSGIDWDSIGDDYAKRLSVGFGLSEFAYPDEVVESYGFSAIAEGDQVITIDSSGTFHTLLFPVVVKEGSLNRYDETVSEWEAGGTFDMRINFNYVINIVVSGITGGANLEFTMEHSGTAATQNVNTNGTTTLVFFTDMFRIAAASSEQVYLRVRNSAGSGSATITVVYGEAQGSIDNFPFSTIEWGSLLPEITQYDFFKDFIIRFALIVYSQFNTIYAKTLQAIIDDPTNVLDWTSKRVKDIPKVEFIFSGFGQENIYKDEDTYNFLTNHSSIDIDNDTLPESVEQFTSVFSAPTYSTANGLRMVKIPVYDFNAEVNTEFDEEPKPALFYTRDDNANDPTVEYNSSTDTTYKIGVYDDPTQTIRADWSYFLETFYPGLSAALQRFKKVPRVYNLSIVDVKEYTPFKKIYDDGELYLVISIPTFVAGRLSRVELFKIQ